MKDKYEYLLELEEAEAYKSYLLQQRHEWDRLFRRFIRECRANNFDIISYTEYYLLNSDEIITQEWLLAESNKLKKKNDSLSLSISVGILNTLDNFKIWMKQRRKEKIQFFLDSNP